MRPGFITRLMIAFLAVACSARADDTVLRWPLPWKLGTTLNYDKTTVTRKQAKGVDKIRNYTDTTVISIVQARPDGFLQRWASRDVWTDSPGATPEDLAADREAVQRMSAKPLDVELDAQGLFARIANLGELQPVYREIVRQGMERGITQGSVQIADPIAREQAVARARAANAQTLERVTSQAVLNSLVAPQPLSYNYFAVGGMLAGQRYEIEDLGENPLGGEPFPMLGSVVVRADPADPRLLLAEWKMALHPQKAAPLLWDALEVVTRSPIPSQARRGLPSQIDVHTELSVRIERATGIVEHLHRVETRQVLDSHEVKTTTMDLRR